MECNKQCKECGETKDVTEFYPAQGECKVCTKRRVRAREQLLKQNPEWVLKEKERHRKKYHRLYNDGRHKPTKEKQLYTQRKYRAKYPEKDKAKGIIHHLKMKPKITGNELHHWSYNKEHYKDVIELSKGDHSKLHRFMVYDQERMMYRTLDGILLDTKERHLEYFESIKNKD